MENRAFNQSYTQFKILHFTAWAVGLCAFLLGGLGVANTMLLSVFGRIREIAVLLVLGFALGLGALAILERLPDFQGYVQASVKPAIVLGIIATGSPPLSVRMGEIVALWGAPVRMKRG